MIVRSVGRTLLVGEIAGWETVCDDQRATAVQEQFPSQPATHDANVTFVSYDGALDPLGASQVVPYVTGLAARGFAMSLITFEKPEKWAGAAARERLTERLARAGVEWVPLPYHRRPRLLATLRDVAAGVKAIRAGRPRLVHCRSDVPMAMTCGLGSEVAVLYDIRGLFSDERVEAGSWVRGGVTDVLVRRAEARNLRRADGLVVLTEKGLQIVRTRRPVLPPHRVIPTCVDLEAFRPDPHQRPEFGLAYCGSLGTWYMAAEMVAFAAEARQFIPGRLLFLTPHVEEAREAGASGDWAEVRAVPPEEVGGWLRRARALVFFIRPTFAKQASCPTKLAEALACGLPVVANRGIGDVDSILEKEGVGVLVDDFSTLGYSKAAAALRDLLADVETPTRCREVAVRRFGTATAVGLYEGLYREMLARGRP